MMKVNLKVKLKDNIIEEIIKQRGQWVSFDSYYGNGYITYNMDFLEPLTVRKTDRPGIYLVVDEHEAYRIGGVDRIIECVGCVVYADHIDFIPDITFKEDIFRILEI